MPLNIKNAAAHALAKKIATLTGESMPKVLDFDGFRSSLPGLISCPLVCIGFPGSLAWDLCCA